MSFLDGISKGWSYLKGNSLGASLVKTVGLALVVNQLSKNAIKDNNTNNTPANIDAGVRLQIPPASDSKIPVLYGSAFFGGNITDAVMSNNNKTMSYCLTLSEKTGNLLSTGAASVYTINNIYWNDQRIVFQADGYTVDYTVDRGGVVDRSMSGLVQILTYVGNTTLPKIPTGYTNASLPTITSLIGWSGAEYMGDLIFAIVKVNYNRDKNVTGLGTVKFHITNSMHKPGDCLYDYMTNTRYGAGISSGDILTA